MSTLHHLLTQIESGHPVNADVLYKKLPSTIRPSDIFHVHKINKTQSQIRILDHKLFSELLMQASPAFSRVDAATHLLLSTHNVVCDSAYMLVDFACSRTASITNCQVVSYQDGQVQLPKNTVLASTAIVIENQDAFFAWRQLLIHLEHEVNLNNCDVFFGGGKRILNPKLMPFLRRYQTCYVAPDYDFGGFKIAQHLLRSLNFEPNILMPKDLTQQARLFTLLPRSAQELGDMLGLCKDLDLEELTSVIAKTRCFMEQEALLKG